MSARPLLVLVLLAAATAPVAGCSSGDPAPDGDAAPTTASSEASTTTVQTTTANEPARLRLALERVVDGLDSPLSLAIAPGERGRLYVVEQGGTIRVVEGGRVAPRAFLDITPLVRSGGEQGLLSVAFHPDYTENRRFYVDYTDTNGDTRVVEYEARRRGAPARRRELLFVDQPYANHNGGQLEFGPDGRLYVGMGDGGSGGDPEDRAQDLDERLGKLLALDVGDRGADWRIVGYGLRNPWRFSFDRETGDLWIADVGQGDWEEVDWTPRRSPGLENYGWDVLEGTHAYEGGDPNPAGRLVGPVAEYSHDEGCSVTGGYVYRGEAIPAAAGRYFYGDFCSGRVWSLRLEDGKAVDVKRAGFDVRSLASFGEDSEGELYVVSLGGSVSRIVSR